MPALQSQLQIITLEQYEALPEDTRAEVFEGQIYYMSSPSQEHQIISMELSTVLNTYIKKKQGACRVFHAPFDVKLNDTPLTIVQPDLMIVCDKDKLDGKRCNGAPDFIIEIVSPSNLADEINNIKRGGSHQTTSQKSHYSSLFSATFAALAATSAS